MQRHDENAKALVAWLEAQDKVDRVIYPGFGGMVSAVLSTDLEGAKRFVASTKVITLAESLGGVESLIELPAIMTHASVPPQVRAEIGIPDGLVRLSVGIEHIDDLKADLAQALATV
jgi:cystathionine gamma-lyase